MVGSRTHDAAAAERLEGALAEWHAAAVSGQGDPRRGFRLGAPKHQALAAHLYARRHRSGSGSLTRIGTDRVSPSTALSGAARSAGLRLGVGDVGGVQSRSAPPRTSTFMPERTQPTAAAFDDAILAEQT
jgi:hypothetical protein